MKINDAVIFFKTKGFQEVLLCPTSKIPQKLKNFLPKYLQQNATLMLVIQGGPTLWNEYLDHHQKNIFDDYSLTSLDEFIKKNGLTMALLLHPLSLPESQKDHFPLLELSRFLNFSHQSPFGFDISKQYATWFGVRLCAVLAGIELETTQALYDSPCLSCQNKPCLNQKKSLPDIRMNCPYKLESNQYSVAQILHHQFSSSKISKFS